MRGMAYLQAKSISMRSNVDLLSASRGPLSGQWLPAIGAILVIGILSSVGSTFSAGVLPLILAGPFGLGQSKYFLSIARGQQPPFEDIFSGFHQFVRAMAIGLLVAIAVVVGMILLVIPGIIAGVGLSMAYFIALDRPELEAPDVLKASWELVWKGGNFWKVFGFGLLAALLTLLGVLCFGFGVLFTTPMILVGQAMLYDELRSSTAVEF